MSIYTFLSAGNKQESVCSLNKILVTEPHILLMILLLRLPVKARVTVRLTAVQTAGPTVCHKLKGGLLSIIPSTFY